MPGPIKGLTRDCRDQIPPNPSETGQKLIKTADIALALLVVAALLSLAYTIATAPWMGKDLLYYQAIGCSWASGVYLPDSGIFYGPAPWTAVELSPTCLLSPSHAVIVMLAANLAAAALSLWLALAIWGRDWTTGEKVFLCCLFVVWAAFRIAVRNGQLSLIVATLLLGFIWARRQKREYTAGVLLGLSLIKYPLSFVFPLYMLWRKQWRTAAVAAAIPLALTLVYAARLGISPIRIAQDYARDISGNLVAQETAFTGRTEIKPMIDHFLGSRPDLAIAATIALWVAALLATGIAFSRARGWEDGHFAALSLLTLWVVFHRPYDAVLLIIPAAVFIELRHKTGAKRFAETALGLLGMFAVSVPGFLVDRLKLDTAVIERNPLGFVGLHLERLIVVGLFSAMLVLMTRHGSEIQAPRCQNAA